MAPLCGGESKSGFVLEFFLRRFIQLYMHSLKNDSSQGRLGTPYHDSRGLAPGRSPQPDEGTPASVASVIHSRRILGCHASQARSGRLVDMDAVRLRQA